MRGLPVAPTSAVGGKKLFSVPSVRCVNRNLLRSPSAGHRRPDVAARELHAFQTLLSPQFHVVDGLGSGGVQSPLLFRRRPALARLGCTHGSRRQRVCLPRRPDAVVGSGRREGKERPAPSGNTMLCSATARTANLVLAPHIAFRPVRDSKRWRVSKVESNTKTTPPLPKHLL